MSSDKKDEATGADAAEATDESVEFGLQADGSVTIDEKNDFSVFYFRQLDCWRKPVNTGTHHM